MANRRAKQGRAGKLVLAAASGEGDHLVLEVSAGPGGKKTLRIALHDPAAAEDLYDALGEWLVGRLDDEDRSAA